jgi:LuxR family transcriptional regulator, maltose regulon positive regulatory protein
MKTRHARSDSATGVDQSAVSVLAEAKLAAPRLRDDSVPRPRIIERLDAGRAAALTLVAAPPGYGKTTAVREWCAGRDARVAWVTLDSGDNDPNRLWTYVATAAERVRNGLGRQALLRLAVAGGSIDVAIDELMNGLAVFQEELVVVLDDLHAITDAECLASIEFAIRRLPASVRLIVITRVEPPFELAGLRASGALVELRSDDLAFETNEVFELLVGRAGIRLDLADAETLWRRTEGWPAALVLASVWLRGEDDPVRAVSEFGGDHRFVAEYLSRVALGTLDDDVRDFLLRASVLGRFTSDLCDYVFDRTDSRVLIGILERSNLLTARLERGSWFRIHSLFADFARFQLAATDPPAEAEIHRRAAHWYVARDLVVEALDHAFAAGDLETAVALLDDHHASMFRSGRLRTLLRFIRALPASLVAEHLDLAVVGAITTTVIGGGAIERRRYLAVVSSAQQQTPERVSPRVSGAAAMLRALTLDGGVTQAVDHGRQAIAAARSGVDFVSVSSLGSCAHALYFAGELDEAAHLAREAIELPEAAQRPPGHALARAVLATVAAEQGQLDSARGHAETARSLVGAIGSGRSWLGAQAAAALGSVHAAEGDLAKAEQEFAYAEHFFRDEVASVQHTWLVLMLARTRCRRGRLDDTATALRSAQAALAELGDSGQLPELAAAIEKELDQAQERADQGQLLSPPSDAEIRVLGLLATDLTTREIGGKLYLSPHTVRSHTRSLYRKLGVTTRKDAVARATTLGLDRDGDWLCRQPDDHAERDR